MVQTTRLELEKRLLRERFPKFAIQNPDGPAGGVLGSMRSNSGTEYVIWLELRSFPHTAPGMFILSPKPLLTYEGRDLTAVSPSVDMHLLLPDAHGHPQICHYNDQYWHPNISLFKILMKARLWLEAYEQHRQRGLRIDAYLGHMR